MLRPGRLREQQLGLRQQRVGHPLVGSKPCSGGRLRRQPGSDGNRGPGHRHAYSREPSGDLMPINSATGMIMKMKNLKRQLLVLLASAMSFSLPLSTTAEDIDIFVGSSGGGAANVLVMIDNTTNWADKQQKWPGNEVQGQAELEALIAVIPTLNDNVNVGLMMFNQNGLTSCCSGGYIRYAMQPMNATNRAALVAELSNVLANFNDPVNTAASNASYSMALFDAFKYFGGFTSPAHATDGIAGSPLDAFHFGPAVFASPPRTFNRPDPLGYTDSSYTAYRPPTAAAEACGGKN